MTPAHHSNSRPRKSYRCAPEEQSADQAFGNSKYFSDYPAIDFEFDKILTTSRTKQVPGGIYYNCTSPPVSPQGSLPHAGRRAEAPGQRACPVGGLAGRGSHRHCLPMLKSLTSRGPWSHTAGTLTPLFAEVEVVPDRGGALLRLGGLLPPPLPAKATWPGSLSGLG